MHRDRRVEAIPMGLHPEHGGQLGHLFLSFYLHSTKTFDIIFPVMRPETKENINKQVIEVARARGTMQSLAESWGTDVKYLQARIAEVEEKLTKVQNALEEIEWSEETDWLGKLNE